MRRHSIWLGAAALAALAMCHALTSFDLTQSGTATVPKGSIVNQVLGATDFTGLNSFDLSQSETFKNQGVSKNQINSVKLKSLALTITAPVSAQDFSFIDTLKFYAEAPNQQRVLVAEGSSFGAQTTIGLDVDNVELAPYVAAASMTLTSEVTGRSPNNDTTLQATAIFTVDVNVQGALCGH